MHLIKTICILSIILMGFHTEAQNVFQPKQINSLGKGLVYKYESAIDVRLNTSGFSIGYLQGDLDTYYKTNFWSFDLSYLKDPRERKQNKNVTARNEGSSNSFTYGKQNSLFILRAGKGHKRYLSEKALRRGLAVGYIYEAGASIAVLKPYYLKLSYPDNSSDVGNVILEERYSEENEDVFTDYNSIFGGSSFWTGITGSSVAVGGHAKAGAHFALGAFDKYVRAVEVGVMMDMFVKKLPVLIETDDLKNRRLFLNLYLSVQIGKRK